MSKVSVMEYWRVIVKQAFAVNKVLNAYIWFQWRSKFDNWGGGDINIFVFCITNFFLNLLFFRVCEHE